MLNIYYQIVQRSLKYLMIPTYSQPILTLPWKPHTDKLFFSLNRNIVKTACVLK